MTSRIGKYEIHSEIGRGAFGRVFRAYDPVTRRNVAIKVLIAENDPDVLARFFLEVQATAKLRHKNIVTIYDFNENPPYIVMELLEGESLQQIIAHHASLSLLEKIRILSQTAEGLACAHKNGIVHRDIKPANIMVLPGGDVKIMDFGIARVSGETEARRTRQGDLIGTILYMSPERIQGAEADPCSDIFSLGAVGYELITGKHPFEGKDYATVIYKITSADQPPIQPLVPECPDALELVLQRELAKEPESRYQSMEDILFDLKPILLELAQQQATPVMKEVQGLIDSGQLSEALDRVRRVLELDPTNREARSVHDSLQKDQRLRQVRIKVDTLLREGETQLSQRQFNKAVQCFESAWRLDASNLHINDLLGQAKAALEANRQASRLLSEARREVLAGNLNAAHEYATEALKADPLHQDVVALWEKLRNQIEERDRQLRAQWESLEKQVRQSLARGDLDRASQQLATAQDGADHPRWQALRRELVERQGYRQRLQRARQLKEQKDYGAAEELLEQLTRDNPLDGETAALLDAVRAERRRVESERAYGVALEEAEGLRRAGNYDGAAQLLQEQLSQALDQRAEELLRTVIVERGQVERQQQLEQGKKEIRALIDRGSFQNALTAIDNQQRNFGGDGELGQLRAIAEHQRDLFEAQARIKDLEQQGQFEKALGAAESALQADPQNPDLIKTAGRLRLAALDQLVDDIHSCFAKNDLQRGGAMLEGMRQRWGREPRWQALQVELERRHAEESALRQAVLARREIEQRTAKIKSMADDARALLKSKDFDKALARIEAALQSFPDDPTLLELLHAIVTGRTEHEQRKSIQQVLDESAKLEHADRMELACAALERALQQYPGESSLSEALARNRQKLVRQQGLKRDLKQANSLIDQGHLPQATQLLQQMKDAYPGEGQVAALLERARMEEQRCAARDRVLTEIQRYLDGGRPDLACDAAARGLAEFGPDTRLISAAAAAERMRARKAALERAQAACREGNWRLAAATLEASLRLDEHDLEARRLLNEVLEHEQADLRRGRRDNGRSEAEKLIQSGRLEEAVRSLSALRDEFPDDTAVRDDLNRAREAVDHKLRREAYTQGRQRATASHRAGQFAVEIKTLEDLLERFPDDLLLMEDLRDAQAAHREQVRRERYATGRRRAAELVQARKFDDAIALLQALLLEFPADALLEEDLKSATGARELQQQREAVDREVTQLERHYRKGDARAVRERASRLPPDLQDARVRELLDWARGEIERSAQESGRESADGLQRRRRQRMTIVAATTAVVVAAAIFITAALLKQSEIESLGADQKSMSFTLAAGAAPASKRLLLDGTPGGLHWSAKSDQDWLSVEPRKGVTPAQLIVSVDARHLTPKGYSGQLIFTLDDGMASLRTDVAVIVAPEVRPGPSAVQEGPKPAPPPIKSGSGTAPGAKPPVGGVSSVGRTAPPPVVQPQDAGQKGGGVQPLPLPEIADCNSDYNLPTSGVLTWQRMGGLEPGRSLVIGGSDEDLAGGKTRGKFPRCKITVTSTPNIIIDEQPRREDGYTRVKLHNAANAAISVIELRWAIQNQ